MIKKVFHLIALILIISCQQDKHEFQSSAIRQPQFTDSIYLEKFYSHLKFNSFGLFDTAYVTVRGDMCTRPKVSYTFSNSDYTCIDSFELLHPVFPEDTMLCMEVEELVTESTGIIDSAFLKFEIDRYKAISRATKSGAEIKFATLTSSAGIPVACFGFEDKDSISQVGMNAFLIQNESRLELKFRCRAINCEWKIEAFKNILKTISLR